MLPVNGVGKVTSPTFPILTPPVELTEDSGTETRYHDI